MSVRITWNIRRWTEWPRHHSNNYYILSINSDCFAFLPTLKPTQRCTFISNIHCDAFELVCYCVGIFVLCALGAWECFRCVCILWAPQQRHRTTYVCGVRNCDHIIQSININLVAYNISLVLAHFTYVYIYICITSCCWTIDFQQHHGGRKYLSVWSL